MLAVKVPVSDLENVRKKLVREGIFDKRFKVKVSEGYGYIPVVSRVKGYDVVDVDLEVCVFKKRTLRDLVKLRLGVDILGEFKSFDVVGDIAIVELRGRLRNKADEFGKCLLEFNPKINTVLMKSGSRGGKFRLQEYVCIAGVDKSTTRYRENGVDLLVDVRKVYFSPRLASERLRIAKLIASGEVVLVMFSGCGVYPFVISKNSEASRIYAVSYTHLTLPTKA